MSGENPEIVPKSPEEFQLGSFRFFLQTNELKDKSGNIVRLRHQSTEVLVCLALRHGELVLKTDLIEAVWPDTFVTDDSLGQCIADIRRALGDSAHRIVRTFPKKGYMLVAGPVSENARARLPAPDRVPGNRTSQRRWPARFSALAVMAVLIMALGWWHFRTPETVGAEILGPGLPQEPSIIVLPFENWSDDADLDYLAAGFSTSIRTHLSKFPQLFVIAGSTSVTYKDSPGTVRGIGREMGVRYVLDGSMRRVGDAFVVTTELVETEAERTIWAQQYSFEAGAAHSVQAELVQEVVATLNVVIGEEEMAAMRRRPTESPKAYDLYLRAEAAAQMVTSTGRAEAVDLLNRAIALDPDYLAVHFELSGRYLGLWRFGGAEAPEEAVRLARHHAERALEISRSDYRGHFRLGMLHLFADHNHDLAYAAFLRALKDNPNDADVLYNMGFLRSLMGEAQEAIAWNDKAKRINPRYPGWYNFNAAQSRFFLKEYEEAETLARTAIAQYPKSLAPRRILIAILVETGRLEEAEKEAETYMAINPQFRLSNFHNTPFQHRADQDRYFGAIRAAGIPD